jgi:hypothetical protein
MTFFPDLHIPQNAEIMKSGHALQIIEKLFQIHVE